MKKYLKILLLILWFCLSILIYDFSMGLLSEPSTEKNLISVFITAVWLIVSIETRGFTKWKREKGRNREKNK